MIRILLAEDQAMVRGALGALLKLERDIEVLGAVADGMQALSECRRLRPDIVVTDIEMPGMTGIELAQAIQTAGLPCKVVIVTTFARQGYLRRALDAGVKGYLLKDSPRTEILSAIRAVAEDRPYTSSSVAAKALQRMSKPSLTTRELDVLQLVAEGRSNKDIARRLEITEGTAKTHVKAILAKLDAISRTEAVAVAHKRGLIRLS